MDLASRWSKNRRSKMTQKRFCRGSGYPDILRRSSPTRPKPHLIQRTQFPNGSQALRCKPRALAQGASACSGATPFGNCVLASTQLLKSVTYVAGRFCYLCS